MVRQKEEFKSWNEYVEFARECDQDPLFKKILDRFIKITS